MTFPSKPAPAPRVWDDPRVRFPDEATWSRMTPAERETTIERIEAVLDEHRAAMSEGTRHFRGKAGIGADLDGHFRRAGRAVYVGCELAVLYPGEPVIVPDVLAVTDCDPDYEPERWVVPDEKRGIDLVIEVRNLGKKHKDVVDNVRDYARVQIPEYFSFDCRRGILRGWRLVEADARKYQPVVPQGGYLRSQVLGLDLAVVGTRLRFFSSGAMIPDAAELAARLQALADQRQGAVQELERQLGDAARLRDEAARLRDDVLDRLSRAQVTLAQGVLDVCGARGLTLTADEHARIASEGDVETLARWMTRALTASTADAVLSRDGAP